MKARISRDAKCIALGATMAVCALSLCSWQRLSTPMTTRIVVQRPAADVAAYKAYYDAAETLISDMRMECDPYADRFDYADYWNAKRNLNK